MGMLPVDNALESKLLQQIVRRDTNALCDLYRRYTKRLSHFLLRMTLDHELAAEVINDVFLVVWDKAGDFRGDSHVSTWILGIAYRKALKALKRRKSTVPLESIEHELLASPGVTPTTIDLDRLIAKLEPEHRAVMELTYYFGYTYGEISEILDCPENTVKTRMFYARKKLKRRLGA